MSIGGELAEVVAIEARRRRQPVGELVAELVHDFEIALGTCVWARAEQTMREAEQPCLRACTSSSPTAFSGRTLRNPVRVRNS